MDHKLCSNCGSEIADGVLVCGYCGHAIPKEQLSESTKQELKKNERSDASLKSDPEAGVRSIGVILMVIGGLCDLFGMFIIGSGSLDVGLFSATCIGGTVCFGLGLFLTFFGRV